MNFNRFFSFGCSFTQHNYPTWANIIHYDLNIPFQNWGRTGAGNQFICSKLVECDSVNKFNEDDLVIIVWSGWNREDRFLDNEWKTLGSIFNNSIYDESFIRKYWNLENDLIKNSTFISLARKAYANVIKFEGSAMDPLLEFGWSDKFERLRGEKHNNAFKKIKDIYADALVQLPTYPTKQWTPYDGTIPDSHPDIIDHLNFVKNKIYPKLGLTIKQSTVNFCSDYFEKVKSICVSTDTVDESNQKIQKINSEYGLKLGFHYGL